MQPSEGKPWLPGDCIIFSHFVTSRLNHVENGKRAKEVTKEGIQSVAVIIAEILHDYMKTKLFFFLN